MIVQEHEYYCDPIRHLDGTPPVEAYVRDSKDDKAVTGPLPLGEALRKAARLNRELETTR